MTGHANNLDFSAHRETQRRTALQMAPLIDIVFLLICFYLLVSQLIQHQRDPSVQLPAMVSPVAQVEAPAEIVINLRADGKITIDGRPVPLETLVAVIAGELKRHEAAGTALRVVVRADKRQRFARLDEVLAACREAGLPQVIWRSKKGGGP